MITGNLLFMKSYLNPAKLGLLAKKSKWEKHKKGGGTWFGILVSFLIIEEKLIGGGV